MFGEILVQVDQEVADVPCLETFKIKLDWALNALQGKSLGLTSLNESTKLNNSRLS